MEIYKKLYELIAEHFGVDPNDLSPETEFVTDLDADSLDVVELALDVETEFGLPEMNEDEIKDILTIENLAEYIAGKL